MTSRLYMDCEFNALGGQLISMALVSTRGEEWYQSLGVPEDCDPWVRENVIPVLGIAPVSEKAFLTSLEAFLGPLGGCEIFADWPADFEHLCACMSKIGARNGYRVPIECDLRLITGADPKPLLPHNALSDARALRDWHIGLTARRKWDHDYEGEESRRRVKGSGW
jgi:hypothetical protein